MLNAVRTAAELTRRFVDLLHEAVLSEMLHEALVAVEDGCDVLVAGLQLHHGIGQNAPQSLNLALLLHAGSRWLRRSGSAMRMTAKPMRLPGENKPLEAPRASAFLYVISCVMLF